MQTASYSKQTTHTSGNIQAEARYLRGDSLTGGSLNRLTSEDPLN